MNFNTQEEINWYVKGLSKELGSGSQGTTYYDKNKDKAVKIYHFALDNDYNPSWYNYDNVLDFKDIDNSTYYFPKEGIYYKNNNLIGYISNLAKGEVLFKKNPLFINLNSLEYAVNNSKKDIELVSNKGILTDDVTYNMMYKNKKISVIDTDSYMLTDMDYKDLLKLNTGRFNKAIKLFLINSFFDEVVDENKLLKEMYNEEICLVEFLKELRQVLSTYCDKDIIRLNDARQFMNIHKSKRQYVRLL